MGRSTVWLPFMGSMSEFREDPQPYRLARGLRSIYINVGVCADAGDIGFCVRVGPKVHAACLFLGFFLEATYV